MWRGADSVPRLLELRAFGLTWVAIARRFGVTRRTIYSYVKNPPPQSTSEAGTTSPEGQGTDAQRILPEPSTTKKKEG